MVEDPCMSGMSGTIGTEGRNFQTLTPNAQRFFNSIQCDVAASAFDQLTQESDVTLLEVACSPASRLSHEWGPAPRRPRKCCWALFQRNGCDLGTGEGVKLIISKINLLNSRHVYISFECGPYSPIQNLNQKTASQREELEKKRREVLKQYVGLVACTSTASSGERTSHGNGRKSAKRGVCQSCRSCEKSFSCWPR